MTGLGRHSVRLRFADLASGFNARWKSRAFLAVFGSVAFFAPFSLLFVVTGFLPEQYGWMASVIIVLSGAATFLSDLRVASVTTAATRFVLITGLLFIVEYAGVKTGIPFGVYSYTSKLGMQVYGVPIAISIAWYCTVMNAWRLARYITVRAGMRMPLVEALYAGLLALGIDIALEPMAGFIQKYWVWEHDVVPVQNYVSWFFLSMIAVTLLERMANEPEAGGNSRQFQTALFLFGFHFVLFFLTSLVHGYLLAAGLAGAVVFTPPIVHVWRMRLVRPDMVRR
jgi:bisanhydrobacterioruberin hydratase